MRIFLTMLGFNTPEMVRGALENLEATTTDAEHRRLVKTLFCCDFPFPSVDENRHQLKKLAAEFGWWATDIPNCGVVENHNVAIHDFYHMAPGDFYVTFDPDVRMQQCGWISAMVSALQHDPNAVFCAAARPFHREKWLVDQAGQTISRNPDGFRIARYRNLIAWSMGMYKGEWLATRPRHFAAENPHYGYAEHCEYDRMVANKKTWIQVIDYDDHHMGAGAEYTEWKKQSAAHQTTESFGEWLKKN